MASTETVLFQYFEHYLIYTRENRMKNTLFHFVFVETRAGVLTKVSVLFMKFLGFEFQVNCRGTVEPNNIIKQKNMKMNRFRE